MSESNQVRVEQDFYFAVVPEWVLDQEIAPTSVVVFLTLARYANRASRSCYPSKRTISERSRLSLNTVDKALRELVDIGAVSVRQRANDHGLQTSNVYTLHMAGPVGQRLVNSNFETLTPPNFGDPAHPISGDPAHPNFGVGIRQEEPDKVNQTREISLVNSDAEFERFWKVYPRKIAKGSARKAWDKAVRKIDKFHIIDAAEFYADQRKGQDPQFTAHPATWLNQERWLDQVDPAYTPKPQGERGRQTELIAKAMQAINRKEIG